MGSIFILCFGLLAAIGFRLLFSFTKLGAGITADIAAALFGSVVIFYFFMPTFSEAGQGNFLNVIIFTAATALLVGILKGLEIVFTRIRESTPRN